MAAKRGNATLLPSEPKTLFDACKPFVEIIDANPHELVSRLWPEF